MGLGMRRIVICLDGTWNQVFGAGDKTNVVKIAQSIRPQAGDATAQFVYYSTGVGTGGIASRIWGGALGFGLKPILERAYAFLVLNYQPDDEIFIFGFSRGAYCARALAGMVCSAGILKQEHFEQIELAWQYYRVRPDVRRAYQLRRIDHPTDFGEPKIRATTAERSQLVAHAQLADYGAFNFPVSIKCVGVWDTVGSYGVPAGFGLGAIARLFASGLFGFHDTTFPTCVEIGLHALAIDEKRRPFAPALWTMKVGEQPRAHVEQVWFAGVHANIGGGYLDSRLSDITLDWMIARVAALTRLELAPSTDRPNPRDEVDGQVYDSRHIWGPIYWPISKFVPYVRRVLAGRDARTPPAADGTPTQPINEFVHQSLIDKRGRPCVIDGRPGTPYLPENLPSDVPPDRVAAW
jgi:uncharacterized protein (DUF2235 family)